MDIPALLDSLCLSQAEIADHLGVTQSTISRWRTGALVPDRRTQLALEALAEKLKLRADHAGDDTLENSSALPGENDLLTGVGIIKPADAGKTEWPIEPQLVNAGAR